MEINDVQFVTGAARWEQLPADGRPEVAFVGRSNVGKSSWLNRLVGRRSLARTSGTPGKTQQFNYYLVNGGLYFVDLPGYGYAKIAKTERARWGRFIGRYVTERAPLRAVFHLIDSRHPPTAMDEDVMAVMRQAPVPYLILLTKTDKLSGNGRAKSRRGVEAVLDRMALEVPIILTSAEDGRGRDEVLRWIAQFTGGAAEAS
ncbi:MAG: ribosome biogenesis GTP-binding protein YihA/YsxC [Rhodothermales bacterium]|nr:ribosome biogenesis GTP-binding protein YihA/YsxC [Rhodothermales bacterium]